MKVVLHDAELAAIKWHHGCGPTAAGMMVYWLNDHGYAYLGYHVVASSGHYQSFSLPKDSSGPILPDKSFDLSTAHANYPDCLADLMRTSQAAIGNRYGWSWFSDFDNALEQWAKSHGYPEADALNVVWRDDNDFWSTYTGEIDAGRPMGLLVDVNGDGFTDHFVAGMAYEERADGSRWYGCLNTYKLTVQWYRWRHISEKKYWSVYAGTRFDPGEKDADFRIYCPICGEEFQTLTAAGEHDCPMKEDDAMKCGIQCEVITNIGQTDSRFNVACQEHRQGRLAVGQTVYGDREYRFTEIPDELFGGHWVQTYNADKGNPDADYIRFTLGCDATVYVCYDERVSGWPNWLSPWADPIGTVTAEGGVVLEVLGRDFSAGQEVVLGGCRATPNGDWPMCDLTNMVVVVVPVDGEPVPPEEEPDDPNTITMMTSGTYRWELIDGKAHLVLN